MITRLSPGKKGPPVYITNFKLQKVDYNHLGTDIFDIQVISLPFRAG